MEYKQSPWKQQLNAVREKYMLANFQACRDHGVPAKRYNDTTANGLTACVMDWLKYNHCYCNRINTMGVQRRDKNGQTKWTKSSTRKGTADLDSIISGRPVKIEIKIGRDRMSDEQLAEQKRVISAGGFYIVVTDMTLFVAWFQQFMQHLSADNQSIVSSL